LISPLTICYDGWNIPLEELMISRLDISHNRASWLRRLSFILVLLAGCSSDSDLVIEPPEELPVAVAVQKFPSNKAELVELHQTIRVIFDRRLEQGEVDATTFIVNGEVATRVEFENFGVDSDLIIVPSKPLEYHAYYEVLVRPENGSGLPFLSWEFATHPGPVGTNWERIDTPASGDLSVVIDLNSGMLAGSSNGDMLFSSSNTIGLWTLSTGLGGPPAQTAGVLKLWDGGTLYGAVTGDGELYRGQAWGQHMDIWPTDPDHFIRAMYGVTTVLGGSLRSEPTMGMVTSGVTGMTTLTGTNRVIRDATWSHDGAQYYLVVGDQGTVYYSRDLETWEDVLFAPAYGALRATVGGISGQTEPQYSPRNVSIGDRIVWSDDGRSWSLATAPGGLVLHDVDFERHPLDSQQYIAVGDNGAILASPDGKDWSALDTGLDLSGVDLYSLRTRFSRWVIVGESGVVVSTPPAHLSFE
jgi:hypothetical protein